MFEKALVVIPVLLSAACLFIHFQRRPAHQPVLKLLLVVLTLFSIFFFTGYGTFQRVANHRGPVLFHWHEMYHYYLGSKYYRELGNSGLYESVALADAESSDPMLTSSRIRDLLHIYESIPVEQARSRAETLYRPRFSDARWKEFEADVEFLKARAPPGSLDLAMYDVGFNPPPTWNVIGTPLANLLSAPSFLPYLDVAMLALCAALLLRSFGGLALMAFVIAFCTNLLADYSWTMGSYLRYGWLLGLVLGISMLKDRRFFLSGLGFGLCAALLLFPAVFALGFVATALLAFFTGQMPLRPVLVFAGGAASVALVLFPLSLLMFGLDAWQVFVARIFEHANTFFVWHIGYQKIAVWGSDVPHQYFWGAEGLENFKQWNFMLRERWHEVLPYHLPFMLMLIALASWSSLRVPLEEGALLIGGLALFLFMIPANYYYAYLALVPAVLVRPSTDWRDHALVAAFFVLLGGFYVAVASSPDGLVQNHRANLLLLAFFLLWVGLRVAQRQAWLRRSVGSSRPAH